jgi:hypothetical protein
MDQLVSTIAAATNVPEEMVLRSARARANADGVEVEAVLRAWSGAGEIPEGQAPPAASEEAAPQEPAAPAAPDPAEPSGPAVEVIAAEPEPAQAEEAGTGHSDEPEPRDPEWEPEEEAVAAGSIPRWLAAVFLIVPTLAVMYALFLPNGPNCGDSGRLAVDPVTGEAVNCDGSPYGVEVIDFFAIGLEEYASCSACHGENGGGAGNFPGFVGGELLGTFPEGRCEDQVEWVRLGTAGWPEPTYGATAKPVGGSGAVMPAFGDVLDEQQLRSVILYERVQFGGQDLGAAIADCGLGEEGTEE